MKSGLCWSLLLVFALAPNVGAEGPMRNNEKGELEKAYQKWWNEPLVWKIDKLPIKGYVRGHRIPYAGSIYTDNSGGTVTACRKYDYAYNRGRGSAAAYERWDARAHKTPTASPGGFFGFRTVMRNRVPDWSGHCNGWAAAAIRHAEPAKSVKYNGVVFTPSDIKGLLAELYTFTGTEMLGGIDDRVINPAAFHMTLTNWVGRQKHPLAMEASPGKEIWNFPVYAYNSTVKMQGRTAEVKVMMAYKHYTEQEFDKAPKSIKNKYFHYDLALNNKGEITGGSYYGDSDMLDFFWVPLKPTQGGTKGNERGNPHLNKDKILALWRASVDSTLVDKWVNIEGPKPAKVEVAKPAEEKPATEQPEGDNVEGSVAQANN
jgi:hypothetical protein